MKKYDNVQEILNHVRATLPYPQHIENVTIDKHNQAIRFTYYGTRYRVSIFGGVEEAKDGFLEGTDAATFMQELLKVKADHEKMQKALKEAYDYFSRFDFIWEGRDTTEGQFLLAQMRSALKLDGFPETFKKLDQ